MVDGCAVSLHSDGPRCGLGAIGFTSGLGNTLARAFRPYLYARDPAAVNHPARRVLMGGITACLSRESAYG